MQMAQVRFFYLLAVLLGVAWAQYGGGQGGQGGQDDDEGVKEEDVFPCYHDMHCLLGEEAFVQAEECHEIANEADMERFWQWLSEEGVDECYGKNPKEMSEIMCPMEHDKKKEMFDNVGKKMMNYITEECQSDNEGDDCKRGNNLLNCLGDKMDQLKKDGKCGADVDNSNNEEE